MQTVQVWYKVWYSCPQINAPPERLERYKNSERGFIQQKVNKGKQVRYIELTTEN